MPNIFKSLEYRLIKQHYGKQTANLSGVPLIEQIHDGLIILDFLFVGEYSYAREAYCLHPLFQSDEQLGKTVRRHAKTISMTRDRYGRLDGLSLVLVMEYRNIANQYLSHRSIDSLDDMALSPLFQVNHMLVADKVRSRKDFELYHEHTHPRSAELKQYFKNWLTRLRIPEPLYQYWKQALIQREKWQLLPELSNGNEARQELVVYVFRDTETKGRFKFDLFSFEQYKLLHTHILDYDDGGFRIYWDHSNTSGYWQEQHYIIGTSVNGESYRGMKEDWRIDFSEWI